MYHRQTPTNLKPLKQLLEKDEEHWKTTVKKSGQLTNLIQHPKNGDKLNKMSVKAVKDSTQI